MSTCGYHSPLFSEDNTWLPQWLQPHRQPTVGEHRRDSDGISSPPCENCVYIGDPVQEQQHCHNAMANAGGYSGLRLHLSGDEDTPAASIRTGREVRPFSLHLSSESTAQLSSARANVVPQIINSGTCSGSLEGSYVDGQGQEIKAVPQYQLEAKGFKDDKLLEVCRVPSKDIIKPLGARRHQLSGGKVDVQKLRNVDANDAVELSIAASEAILIAEMIINDCQPDKLAAAALESALHVKEARKQYCLEETEHDCGSFENDLDERDWLAELDEVEMLDAFEDVGLSTVQTACSSQGYNTIDIKRHISQPSCAPRDMEERISDICSSWEQNTKWHSQDANTYDHVPDSLANNNNSAGNLPNESTPGCDSVKQPAIGSFGTPVRGQSIIKECGRVVEETNVGGGTRKHIRTSFISESMDTTNECSPAPRARSIEMVASSRASFPRKTEGFYEENQSAESCYQVVCSSLSLGDPLCSFVPCSISCNEVSLSQAPECKQRNGDQGETIYPKESLKKDLDLEADPSSSPLDKAPESVNPSYVPLDKAPESADPSYVPLDKTPESGPWRRRIYSSLRHFSTSEPISDILGGSTTHNDIDAAVCQKKRGTPITLNKKIQRVQASNQFIENNAEAGSSKEFSLVQKKSSHAQDKDEHQSREKYVPSEVCPQSTCLNVGKRDLKRKGAQLLNPKLSTRQTKSRRFKSRFSWSDSRTADMLEPREYIDKKEAIFHGLEFLLTGLQSHKEKEIESAIRKFGGCILSKVPPCTFDKRSKLAEFARWKPPVVLSSKKVSTAKFLYGCATDSWILNPNWLFDSIEAGVLLPPGKYLIRQRHAVKESLTFGQSVHLRNDRLVFRGVGFLIHGKISFCSKFSNIIKHGGGQVFVSLEGLIRSLKDRSSSHGIILVANEPASWIISSLFSGKLNPLKKDRCASFRRIKMPSFQPRHGAFDMSQEI
ncbi:hypothetical protein BRADI_1g04292v3 [Brachypodium distachyon]|uniref:BRCT domain-containing protein n=1 Tax=Brachypodium distachyon TaxID=15368 RepID=A0A2K2DI22_BRADI|nr:hypothetical protein BRADI_1g04292v3 [Brachypodium distachyon]